ncbi:TonB-dependent receptor [Pedobacter sp. MR2016-24]|uniref:TonB-dependent receptor n=1 Tax=Pedobacter sp. MR2016-24 TaxID=2994466 RepID=UPI00224634BD|nr:carboxypeptidase regulatory-like domain-containing protein [Pedobacter sp. MR2016-24]MCX2483151.1 carboxypeptidase regulatory-like domain-containing protein [Pedobacter sp. MR2016-24]
MRKYLLIIFLLISVTTSAQNTKTSISGKVVTETGEILTGASITLTQLNTGTIYGCVSNSSGLYFMPNVNPGGPYLITLQHAGYEAYQYANLHIKLDEPLVFNITVHSKTIVLPEFKVTGSAREQLVPEKRGPMFHIGYQEFDRLPTLKRSIADFIRLTPQAYGGAVAGGNYRQNFITIDGSEFNNNFGVGQNLPGNGAQPVSLDAIAQISVSIAPYHSIWESGFIGTAVNMITRSGGNNITGAAYSYFHSGYNNADRNAKPGFTANSNNYHVEGFRMGGPAIENKLFYFLSYEQERESYTPQVFHAATEAFPFGSATNIARPTERELDEISLFLKETYGYETGSYQDYTFQNKSRKVLGRIDWNIATNNTFSIRYNQLNSSKPELLNGSRSPLIPYSSTMGRTTSNALNFNHSNFTTQSNFYSLAAEWNSKPGAELTNTIRGSYTRQYEPRTSDSQLFPFVDILKDGVPFTSFGYEPFTYGNKREVKVLSLTDYLTWNYGRTNNVAGFQVDYSKTNNSYMPFATGYYTYASWEDFATHQKPQEYALTYPLNSASVPSEFSFNAMNVSAYFQQTRNLSDRLKITVGVRSDIQLYPAALEENELLASLNFADGQQLHTSKLPKPTLLLSPRMGFRYDLNASKTLQLRGGTGIFTGRIPYVWVIAQARYSGLYQITQAWQGKENTPALLSPAPPAYPIAATGNTLPSIVSLISRDFKMPQSWKSSLALDISLPADFKATLETIFNRDLRGVLFKNVNLKSPTPLSIPGYPDNRLVYPSGNADKYINPLNSSGIPDAQGSSPLNAVMVYNSSKGYYLSIVAQIEKRSRNLSFSIAYSHSRARSYHDGDGDQTLSALNATPSVNGVNHPELSYAGYVMPNRVVSTLTYHLQYAKNLKLNIGLVYQGSNEGRFSYTYSRDFTRDGTNNSLIYVPANPSEIQFAPLSVVTSNGLRTFSAAAQSDAFFKYVEQDSYLRKRKGKYAERNGALFPWRNQFDLRLSQDLNLNLRKKSHTLQLTCDILNAGNLINPNWGLRKVPNASALLVPSNLNTLQPGGSVLPAFQLAVIGEKLITDTFRDDVSLNSAYQLQFGLRYIF